MEIRITQIAVAIVGVWYIIKCIRDTRRYMNYTVPRQLLLLVRQAHRGKPEQMLWDIEVSEEMQTALRAPLTPQQMSAMAQLGDDVDVSVDGYVLSHKLKDEELSGIVCFSVDVSSRSGICSYKYSGVKLRITVRHTGQPMVSKRWAVSSAEQITE